MCQGRCRERSLNPIHFLNLIDRIKTLNLFSEEVILRRIISSLYFSLFNYWAYKKYFIRGERGRGPYQDNYPVEQFYRDMLSTGKDRHLIELLYYRVAADHHIANPTKVRLYISRSISFGEREVRITLESVLKLMEIVRELLDAIEKM